MKSALRSAETIALLVAVAVPVHLVASVDWPWAIVIGALAGIVLRALIHHRTPARTQQ
jgi:predicted branched-subunit amino acid permease